mmetsp:Transcript_59783/g.134908  ORF Transcript_59783/g.134908 Transcript_59783/m.134908 type:complete len:176 (+) Transcript_59783:604-1131(+)
MCFPAARKSRGMSIQWLLPRREVCRSPRTWTRREHITRLLPNSGPVSRTPPSSFFERRMNIKGNTGSKGFGSNGMKRMLQFCNWAFTDPAAQEADTIIVTGHSLWFRTFFQTFLCGSENHFACKKSKMKNAGVVTFNLIRISPEDAGEPKYMIEPNSLQSVFPTEDAGGAFERSK